MDKILTLYFDPNPNHPDVVNPIVFIYKGFQLPLDTSDEEKLISILPEFWHTENDRLYLFTVFSNGEYYCERQKTVYNYSIKTFETIPYVFDAADEEKSREFIELLSSFFQEIRIQKQNDLQQSILNSFKNNSITQTFILNTRKYILSQTDYMFIGDYPIPNDIKDSWAKYRQEWRDITKQEAWISNEIYKLKLPISPSEKDDFTLKIMGEMGHGDPMIDKYVKSIKNSPNFEEKASDLINRYCEYMLKSNILNNLSKFKLPLFDLKFGDTYEMVHDQSVSFEQEFSKFAESIDTELKSISEELSISSIISYYREMNQNSNLTQEIIDILEELENNSEDS